MPVRVLQNPISPATLEQLHAEFKTTAGDITCRSRRPLEIIAHRWLVELDGAITIDDLADLIFGAMSYGAALRRRDELQARLERDHMHAAGGAS